MHTGQALDLVFRYDSLRNPLTSLGDYPDLNSFPGVLPSPAPSLCVNDVSRPK